MYDTLLICSALHPFSYKAIPLAHRCVQDLELAGQAFPKSPAGFLLKALQAGKGIAFPAHLLISIWADRLPLHCEEKQSLLFFTEPVLMSSKDGAVIKF